MMVSPGINGLFPVSSPMPRESCGGELVRADQRGKYGQVRQRGGALRQLN